jgi:uncharacterized protein YhaN
MVIKELHLTHFGRFHNTKIVLSPTLNMIYGKNEAGKSTMYHFIVGMLYGFFKPHVKNRRYLELHELYKPWSGGEYIGSLIFYDAQSDLTLRIQRNFNLGQESVAVYREDTQEDITHTYEINGITRLPDVAKRHIELSYITFVNTFGIAQLSTKTHDDLELEIKDYVLSALSTSTSPQSVQRIFDDIQKKLDDIGSLRRKSSPYYVTKERLTELTLELAEAREHHQELFIIKQSIDQLEIHEKEVEDRLKRIEMHEQLSQQEELLEQQGALSQKIERIDQLVDLMFKQTKKLNELSVYDEFSLEELELGFSKYNQMKELKNKLYNLEMEISEVVTKGKPIVEPVQHKKDDLSNKMQYFEKQEQTCLEVCNREQKKQSKAISRLVGMGLVFFVTLISSFSLVYMKMQDFRLFGVEGEVRSFLPVSIFLGMMLLIEAGGLVYGVRKLIYQRSHFAKVSQQLESIRHQLAQVQLEIGYYTTLEIHEIEANRRQRDEELDEKNRTKACLIQEIAEKEEHILPIVSYYLIQTPEEFIKVLEKKKLYERAVEELNQLTTRRNDLLMSESLDMMVKRLEVLEKRLEKLNYLRESRESLEPISEDKAVLQNLLEELRTNKNQLYGKLESLAHLKRNLASIEEEIESVDQELKFLEESLRVHQKVYDKLQKITQELAHNFAPYLNQSLSSLVEYVTQDKYHDIKVNPQLSIRFYDESGDHSITPDKISQGTKDLFYLSLRRALSLWISKNKSLPIVYDEPFAHFDDERLVRVLEFLSKNEGQSILLTCQKREVSWFATFEKSADN